MQDASTQPLVVWRLMDGKPGHESQTLGLVNALKRLATEQGLAEPRCIDMPLGDYAYPLWDWLFKRFAPVSYSPARTSSSAQGIAPIGPCCAPGAALAVRLLR